MKTTYTNEQLQEAVDRAFRKSSKEHLTTLKYTEDEIWEDQTKTRLVIARAFLDNLLEQTELTKLRAACDRMSKQEVLSLPQLRPISEAGPVPEGCVRVTAFCFDGEWIIDSKGIHPGDTDFADIRLPDPAEKPTPTPLVTEPISLPEWTPAVGMSLRDWFAGMALQGKATRLSNPHEHRDILAADCYDIADAMLKAREVNAQ